MTSAIRRQPDALDFAHAEIDRLHRVNDHLRDAVGLLHEALVASNRELLRVTGRTKEDERGQ